MILAFQFLTTEDIVWIKEVKYYSIMIKCYYQELERQNHFHVLVTFASVSLICSLIQHLKSVCTSHDGDDDDDDQGDQDQARSWNTSTILLLGRSGCLILLL